MISKARMSYYASHREELLPRMREISRQRRAELRELYRENPEALETARAKARERYKRAKVKKATERLKKLAEQVADDSVKDAIITILDKNSVAQVPSSVLNSLCVE